MHHERRILKSVFTFVVLVGVLFGLLTLVPAMAQTHRYGRAAPDEFFVPPSDDGPVEILGTSATGHIVDDKEDLDPYFKKSTAPDGWEDRAQGWGSPARHERTDVTQTAGDWAEWHPDLPDGDYEVQAHWRIKSANRTDAQYAIIINNVTHTIHTVDQTVKADGTPPPGDDDSGWYSLGVYTFRSGAVAEDFVRLTDSTSGGVGTYVIADAIKFSPMEVWVDPSYCDGCANDGRTWDVTAFSTIQDGVNAVAAGGEVHVNAATYNEDVVLNKRVEVSGAGAASTTIQPTGASLAAVEVLTNSVAISGFTIEEAASGATYGIANYDTTSASWVTNLSNYLISSNTIKDFDYGVYMKECSGETSGNTIQGNKRMGIWLEGAPTVAPIGPSTISGNTLSSNGDGLTPGEDTEILVEDMYTGTVVSGNAVNGDDTSSDDVGIHIVNESGGTTVSGNHVVGCHWGVQIFQDGGTDITQKVNLVNNTIRNGHTGIRVRRSAGSWVDRQIVIGGDLASSNSIYGNSNTEVRLVAYSDPISATYNDWGVYNLRAIEDKIRHQYDSSSLGLVTYEPALGVPYTITVEASPTSLAADGGTAAMITATVEDVGGHGVYDTMIGITTSLGTASYGHAEAEDTSVVTQTGAWVEESYGRASGGRVLRSANVNWEIGWTFTGEAVSVIYMKSAATPGVAEVFVDDVLQTTIDMTSSEDEHQVEQVIATGLAPGPHTIMVRSDGIGRVWVDAFRSGGLADSRGRVFATLTSTTTGSALVYGTVYDGRIITDSSTALFPILTDTVQVNFDPTDVHVLKTASAPSINAGEEVTFTITYGNSGVVAASGVVVTDTLPAGLVDVSTDPAYDSKVNVPPTGTEYVWNVGTVEPGATGGITIVARPDPTVSFTMPVTLSNAVDIDTDGAETALANNSDYADVIVLPPANLAITAYPPEIPVSNGEATSTLTVTVTDSSGHPVDGVTVDLTSTAGSFVDTGFLTHTITTTMGIASTELASDSTVATATVTAVVMPQGAPSGTVQVLFTPAAPATIEAVADPMTIPVCVGEAVITATIKDEFGYLVGDDTVVNFNVVNGAQGEMYPRLTTTVDGIATSTVRAKGYHFGDRFLEIYVLAEGRMVQTDRYQRVDLIEGPPDQLDFSLTPPTIQVDGDKCEINALVMDCGSNPVIDGTVVTFTVDSLGTISPTTTTTMDGVVYTEFWSKCVAGGSVVTATVDSRVFTTTVPIEPGPPRTIFVDISPSTIRNCGGTAVVTATVYDVCLNRVKDNTPVLFTPQYGYVSVLPALAWTQDGAAIAVLTALDKPLETWPMSYEQINATSGALGVGFSSLSIVPGEPEIITVTTDRDSIPLDGDVNFDDIIVVARVADCSDTPVEDGASVTVQTDLGFFRESGTRTFVGSTVTGLVTATLTSQTEAGLVTVTAVADSEAGVKVVRFLPDPPYYIDVWGAPPVIRADGEGRSYITAHLMDQYYNTVLDGVTVTFVTDWGQFMGTYDIEYTTFTDADGLAHATLIAADEPHNALVRAIAYNEDLASDVQGYTYVLMVDPWRLYMPIMFRQGVWP